MLHNIQLIFFFAFFESNESSNMLHMARFINFGLFACSSLKQYFPRFKLEQANRPKLINLAIHIYTVYLCINIMNNTIYFKNFFIVVSYLSTVHKLKKS